MQVKYLNIDYQTYGKKMILIKTSDLVAENLLQIFA